MNEKEEIYLNNYLTYIENGLRKGQAIFNAVHDADPDTANLLRGTSVDCYYFDERIGPFMKRVYEIWEGL